MSGLQETSPLLLIMQKESMPSANNPLVYTCPSGLNSAKNMHILYSAYLYNVYILCTIVYTWYAIREPLLTWYLDRRASISADGQQIFNHRFCTLKASTVNRPIKWRN